MTSKRQLGSVWKPVIYAAAMQLGWSPLDLLDNHHNAFPFEGVWYYPRAAHSASQSMSMAWAGVHSENRASVWLLYHLTDRLSVDQLLDISTRVGLARQPEESHKEYIVRIRDKYGVISTRKWIRSVAFNRAKRSMLSGMEEGEEKLALLSLFYGQGVGRELGSIKDSHNQEAARFNFKSLQERSTPCREAYQELVSYWERAADFDEFSMEDRPLPPDSLQVLQHSAELGRIECGQDYEAAMSLEDLSEEVPPLWIDGKLSDVLLSDLERQMLRLELTYQNMDPYEHSFLVHHPDFQLLINMRYIALMAKRLGVEGDLPPVLSLPLGAVDVSLLEAANLYGGLLTGQWVKASEEDPRQLRLIEKILNSSGDVLYAASPTPEAVSDPVTGQLVAGILRNVVQNGTGRRARGKVTIGDHSVPLIGKTGTTNDFQNAAFCGLAPAEYSNRWSIERGLVIAAYVGYDRPRPMSRGNTRISGASGPLPVWMATAQGAADSGILGSPERNVGLFPGGDIHSVSVDSDRGLPDPDGPAKVWIYDADSLWGQEASHKRRFAPMQLNGPPVLSLLEGEAAGSVEEDGASPKILPRAE
jgi:penicillin-binding protein 1A